ncbi:MAG: methylated-DNA (protein)-cysteine S-methyltransferase [Acidimicrobiales bacterium]|nr:methylated-DNA (protein)-cysteine S-methyltransferase [Acidimicrobiales bacterium]
MRYTHVESPIGRLLLVGRPDALTGLYVADHEGCRALDPTWTEDAGPFTGVVAQLREYFAGQRTEFDLPLEPSGTPFQLAVWAALEEIPFGETRGYGELARRIGRPSASRAVGAANGRNPISIIVPCHRVIGSDGSLTGYGWGTARKSWLLDHERSQATLFG